MYTVVLFYRYVWIKDPEKLIRNQKKLCEKLHLRGRGIIAHEGINATYEGRTEDIEKFIQEVQKDKRFADIHFKKSAGNGNCFPKLSIKVRPEIVSLHLGDKEIDPNTITGKYLTPEELNSWFEEKREFYIVDMRNTYEQKSGHFEGSILPNLLHFRDLPAKLPQLAYLKNKTVLTVCTGGVRCEKASSLLLRESFNDVYQLKGGIVSYMEKYPNKHFKGKLYVFDRRIVMGFNTQDSEHTVIGRCEHCNKPSEHYINCKNNNCHRHFICCKDCLDEKDQAVCPVRCTLTKSGKTMVAV